MESMSEPVTPATRSVTERVQGAVTLKGDVYREIGADDSATGQAILVALAAALVGGLGALLFGNQSFFEWIIGAALAATLGLGIGTGILWLIGRLFGATGTYMSLFRGLAFAYVPSALGIVPVIGSIVGGIWAIVCGIVAVRETQFVSQGKAAAIVLIPVAILFFLGIFLAVIAGLALMGMSQG